MKRLLAILAMLMIFSLSAVSAESSNLSTIMDAPLFSSYDLTADEWIADEQHRSLLTAVCWIDYNRLTDVKPCPETALSEETLTAVYSDKSFLFVVIPVEEGRLTFYCLPQYGSVSYMWESGDYNLDYKQTALEEHGMTVYRNAPEAVAEALQQLRLKKEP